MKSLEEARAAKVIGKALEASVSLRATGEGFALLERYSETIPELLNVSAVEIAGGLAPWHSNAVIAVASPATGPKCERCWRYVPDVGTSTSYPNVCLRCADALAAIHYPPYTTPGN